VSLSPEVICDEGEVERDVADRVLVFGIGAPGGGNDELPQGESAPGPRPACMECGDAAVQARAAKIQAGAYDCNSN